MRKTWFAGLLALLGTAGVAGAQMPPDVVTIDLSAGHPAQTIRPDEAFGGALDGMGRDQANKIFTPHNIKAMLGAGLGPVTYRLRPELGIEAWHWNSAGAWSDAGHKQGYWTSSTQLGPFIKVSWGYSLPRRGDTIDNANDTGYSRLDDGDLTSFWKSNPYLDKTYTGMADSHPQWVTIDMGAPAAIDSARIVWGTPYAVAFTVQYWAGTNSYDPIGHWVDFPHGAISDGAGGTSELHLSDTPVTAQWFRVYLTQGSQTAPLGSSDIRDRLGFAINEIYLGMTSAGGVFHDIMKHGKSLNNQTVINASSTDPWHREADRDLDTEQPGIDMIYQSGMTRGLPMMVPAGVLYDIPGNAAALVRYIEARHYALRQVELGEEPDGQYGMGQDYADLFIQGADAIHAVDAKIALGGPSLQDGIAPEIMDSSPDKSFTHQFIQRLTARGRLSDLKFFSYEDYAFDDMCRPMAPMLLEHPNDMDETFATFDKDDIPHSVDKIITEYGFSAFSGRPMVEVPSALLNADIVGHFLTKGGKAAYLFGYTPDTPVNQHLACAGYGNMMLQEANNDDDVQAKWNMPIFYGAQMMTQQWVMPGHKVHLIYPADSSVRNQDGNPWVTAYAVYRPDGQWAVMLVNRDPKDGHAVALRFKGASAGLSGKLTLYQYSSAQFVWRPHGETGHPSRDLPPARSTLNAGTTIALPPFSLSVVRGKGPKPPGV